MLPEAMTQDFTALLRNQRLRIDKSLPPPKAQVVADFDPRVLETLMP